MHYRMIYSCLPAALAWLSIAAPGARADVTYNYVGNTFTNCTFGPCPSNYTSDYITASLTFSTALAPNLPTFSDVSATLTGWSIRDALGYFSYSSSDPATQNYLTGFAPAGAPPLAVSTDASGNIVNYVMVAFPAEALGVPGGTEALITNPPVSDPKSPVPIADVINFKWGTSAEWDALGSQPGRWTVPEPHAIPIMLFSSLALFIVRRRGRVAATSR